MASRPLTPALTVEQTALLTAMAKVGTEIVIADGITALRPTNDLGTDLGAVGKAFSTTYTANTEGGEAP